MRLVLASFSLAVLIGFLAGGRLSGLGRLDIRWQAAAVIGLGLQFAPWPGTFLPLLFLFLSFALLVIFAVLNIRVAGFPLIFLGILANFLVIGMNHGMPVSRHALEASDQTDSLTLLIEEGGAKHHLASPDDHLVFLGDVIPIAPIQQAVSVGDVLSYAGVMWLIVAGMRSDVPGRRERRLPLSADPEGVGHVDG
jgi:predicted membrane metal-binding protein